MNSKFWKRHTENSSGHLWPPPWNLAEGFLIGAGLLITGLLLQYCVGPIDWNWLAFPANVGVLLAYGLVSVGVYLLRSRFYAFRYLSTFQASVPALIWTVFVTILLGLLRQAPETSPLPHRGLCLDHLLSAWYFVLIYVWLMVVLTQTVLNRVFHFRLRDIPFLLNHFGLLVAMLCATLGNADMRRLLMVTTYDSPEWHAMDQRQQMVDLPLAIELRHFVMETYDDGSPRRFTSNIQIHTSSGQNLLATVEVNKPVEVEGWKIYQYGYDTERGAASRISILEMVRDPWLPYVYAGIFMMLGGAVSMMFQKRRRPS